MHKTPLEWLILVGMFTFAAVSHTVAMWRWLIKPIREEIARAVTTLELTLAQNRSDWERKDHALETRIADVATVMQTAIGRLEVVERFQERASMDREGIHEDIGALREQVKELARIVREGELKHVDEWGEVRDRLARIETKLDHR